MRQEYFEKYTDSVYALVNNFSREELERSCAEFEHQYKGVLPVDKNLPVLDLGCGGGAVLYFFQKQGFSDLYGIDLSPQQVDLCRQQVTDKVEVADALDFLQGKTGKYALIIAHDMLEHVPKDKALPLVHAVHGALREGGIFIVRVPNMSNPLAAHGRYVDMTHEVGYTSRSLRQLLLVGGFSDIMFKGGMPMLRRGWRAALRRCFIRLYYRWVKFMYFVQDYQVPEILDHNLIAIARKGPRA